METLAIEPEVTDLLSQWIEEATVNDEVSRSFDFNFLTLVIIPGVVKYNRKSYTCTIVRCMYNFSGQ